MIWVIHTLNGISFGILLFLLAAGLSLIYGLMKILNLTHGSYYLVGAYIGSTVIATTGSFILALIIAPIVVAALGAVMERFFLRQFHLDELPQTLLTFGFLFIFADLSLWIWGGDPIMLPKPALFSRSIDIGGLGYPTYRLLLIGVGLLVALILWWFQERTRVGAMLRAGVDDAEIARAMGIDVSLLFTLVFAVGALLAALGGVLGGPIIGAGPGTDFDVMLLAFVVVIVGGLGSLRGALVGGLVVGLLDNFGKIFFPEFALFTIFVPMAVILSFRPTGLFGRA
ncbi:branched-chain amino acid ABC transporter permease [Roseiarcaceae bacterium H3SJ34-1]|uniref:branched-chain amino acid ABC transporter permease n=1 Tax=Terripilifer ovatus TaxID=3032367 RepID=UPI003AB94DA0|nr:branched-chain amino acid ABC transporter permease [Roseiarcaceae bacterium H3SJ34-1]